MPRTTDNDAFGRLLDRLYHNALDERDKGSKFERLMRSYFMTDPAYASDFSKVWLWDDYPARGGRVDVGIDLVAERRDGTRVAIQAKFYDPDRTISKDNLDSFIAASATQEFSERMFVSTSLKGFGKNAEALIETLEKPFTHLGLTQLYDAPIDWSQFSLDQPDRMVRSDDKKSVRPHQQAALDAIGNGFKTHDRGKLIMACGTGKTYTALQVVQQLTEPNSHVLFLVPSIALLSQTLTEWKRDATNPFDAFAVCSDTKVGKNIDADVSTIDLLIPATTDSAQLLAGYARLEGLGGRTIVFSTYQSIDVIAQAQKEGLPDFDLVICDEAHRTTGANLAGKEESAFTKVHNQDFIHAAKRLYMTATPRVFDEATRKKADEQSVVVASMDDEALYGPEFYRLGFGDAVERGLLTDYKVIVLAVHEDSVNKHMQNVLRDEDGQLKIDDVAKLVGFWKGMTTRGADSADPDDPAEPNETSGCLPLKRAVGFASNIRESQKIARSLELVSQELAEGSEANAADLTIKSEHVDGSMNVAVRNSHLRWLAKSPKDPREARVLMNARCLSEGVDVPTLDAVGFFSPRNSQVDVVQSVGRVMRRAQGKDYGYIILPVTIPAGMTPEQALKDNKRYKVIWSVLNALRSHDDRFEAIINKIDLQQNRDSKIEVDTVAVDDDGKVVVVDPDEYAQGEFALEFPGLEDWNDSIYAKIVEKVGDREYWENWSGEIAKIAQAHTDRISALVFDDPTAEVEREFAQFVKALRANLNDGVTDVDAVSMLSQHIITKPVFDALFEGYDFAAHNPVSRVMDSMVQVLEGNNLRAETHELDGFYASVARRAEGIDNASGKQRIITELYENFFKKAFPKQAEALGIVYTPVEVVDFILRSVDQLSKKHFGMGLTDEGVHVLDPFTGTGTFIVRLIQSGIISPHDLARKYANELHANEIMLLAYYVAAINIEATYHGVVGGEYAPFEGIVLTDTFQMTEDGDTLDTTMFTQNNDRAVRQLNNPIQVIIGNPPYSAGQTSANDNNANQTYPTLDERIRATYVANTKGQNVNSLYDSYIRAIRWGTDRLGDKGVLAYVTNGGYIDSNSADGLRKSLSEDFDHLYVYNLRGNQRTSGEQSRKEGGKIFDSGSRATVAIMLAVKDPAHQGDCVLYYRDIGDYLSREEKLEIVESADIDTIEWSEIEPSERGEWINQSSTSFDTYSPIGAKKASSIVPVFTEHSGGLSTSRDAWCYSFSQAKLQLNIKRTIAFYNEQCNEFQPTGTTAKDRIAEAKNFAEFDSTKISWSDNLFRDLANQKVHNFEPLKVHRSMYRPFQMQMAYFARELNDRVYQLPRMFPEAGIENYGFYLHGINPMQPFVLLATDLIPCLDLFGKGGQFFSRYTYEKLDDSSGSSDPQGTFDLNDGRVSSDTVVNGYRRIDNISDDALARYQEAFGAQVTKDDIFASIYALLHSEQYRTTYAADLKRQLPRIPLPDTADDFRKFVEAGEQLLELHIRYEEQPDYPLGEETAFGDAGDPAFYRVQKLRWGGKTRTPDKTQIVVNDNITLTGIPDEAHEYMLGSRSALEWILDRYQVKTDKASGIVNDPNDWGLEHGNPRYIVDLIKKVTHVSVETVKIVKSLPKLTLKK
ncbi:type ISP restriction/modification enzyme [uncultured Brevibacterium sp.]|uniref:DEAD/DEAH box helicase n=1 Tax=uncultured Brevibacterium sp. TaxID=189678 RepID=UPI0025DF9E99|nr:type ISP restriction/modification enzyme [uncultured Brevibacterium sp.]